MKLDFAYLDETERLSYMLRELYMKAGYQRYRMSKFEEYDLYSRNKSFLVSDEIITFTDTNGRLMALKPDVTLSIIKNTPDGQGLRRLCYNENVYRVSRGARAFREIMQTGLECMGEVDASCVSEVIGLAIASLRALGRKSALEICDLDLLSAFVGALGLDEAQQKQIYLFASQKNLHEIEALCREQGADAEALQRLTALLSLGTDEPFSMEALWALCRDEASRARVKALQALEDDLKARGLYDGVQFDFSSSGNRNYYNGLIFKGYIEGLSESVLAGGQYDRLMRRMGRNDRAIGFAVYLDALERLDVDGRAGEASC